MWKKLNANVEDTADLTDKVDNARKLQGPNGPLAFNSSEGMIGPVGPSGFNGTQGPRGIMGHRGFNGSQGPLGPAGPPGINGTQGPRGIMGPQGFNGSQGPIGPAEPPGSNVTQGPRGIMGYQGFNGSRGVQGPTGPQGAQGAGNFSQCVHKTSSTTGTQHKVINNSPAGPVQVTLEELSGKRIVGVTCSTDIAQKYLLSTAINPADDHLFYYCKCYGHYGSGSQVVKCTIHYWECPLTT